MKISLTTSPGQRYEVIVNATEPVGNYWLRVGTGGGSCDGPNANAANIRSIFRYAGAPIMEPNTTGTLPQGCYDEDVVPYAKTTVPQKMPAQLSVGFNSNWTSDVTQNQGLVQWLVNDVPMAVDLEVPTLQSVLDGNVTYGNNRHVFAVDTSNQVSSLLCLCMLFGD
jgi:hypothetical protein